MSTIRRQFYDESRMLLSIYTPTHIYAFSDIPISLYWKTRKWFNKAQHECDPTKREKLHGKIWQALKNCTFKKEEYR